MRAYLKVNGVDFTDFIAKGGLKWQRNDIDASNSGRTIDGMMHRRKVTTKIRLDITCKPLDADTAMNVLNTILPEYVSVDYYDPMYGERVGVAMYSNNNPASFLLARDDGNDLWGGITFPLIER